MDRSAGESSDLPPYRYTAALANEIEEKWIGLWEEQKTYFTPNPTGELLEPNRRLAERPPFYVLDMFPYPSGAGLHVGHPLGYIGTDIFARFKRMDGFNVLHAMGYDAFGLPAERYAVDTGQHPEVTTAQNVANMRKQLRRIGLGHDPRRGVETTDPEYYRWTQWIFLQIFNSWYDEEAQRARPIAELRSALDSGARERVPGAAPDSPPWRELSQAEQRRQINSVRLAYLAEVTVNWCPALGTVLANEEVTAEGLSEQGNFPVYRRPLRQWMMRITAYADRLIEDLEALEWSESLKTMQRNWIGRSAGAALEFGLEGRAGTRIEVFTTRPDTLFGVTFVCLAPEHPLLGEDLAGAWEGTVPPAWRGAGHDFAPDGGFASPQEAVDAYRRMAERRSDRRRQQDDLPTGVFTGLWATHPLTGERLPVFAADYVLMQYGSGAVMGVPAHDTRDFSFAKRLEIPIKMVIEPPAKWLAEQGLDPEAGAGEWPTAYTGDGASVGSGGETDGLPNRQAGEAIVTQLAARGAGRPEISYRLRDWLFSRQRYWGEPFPIVYDEDGEPLALPDSELPVRLPKLDDFTPKVSEDEEAEPEPPLARAADWAEVELDLGDGPRSYRRETNTMPQWAGSCWYYLRYLDPNDGDAFVDPEVERYWLAHEEDGPGGVDLYVGGVEHAVLHLLYARFWHKVLHDLGHVTSSEPFHKLFNQGYVQAAAYTDARGFYVEASEVEERDGAYFHAGQPVERSYGKMGKSLKNGVSPDEIVADYGADALRLYEMFLGPLDQDRPWDTQGITGVVRFLQRIWRYAIDEETGEARVSEAAPPLELTRSLHRTIAAVRRDIERLQFNTAIAALMELSGELRTAAGEEPPPRALAEAMILALAPFAPHLSEELWQRLGHEDSVVYAPYPQVDPELAAAEQVEVAVQVDGKLRASIEVEAGLGGDELAEAARALPRIAELLDGQQVGRTIVVPDKIVNFVLSRP